MPHRLELNGRQEIDKQMPFRRAFLPLVLLVATPLFAQSNEIGVFINHSSFRSNTASDPAIGLTTASVKFDSKAGYGITFDHFVSPDVSVQFSGQTIRGDAKVEITSGGATFAEAGGTLELREYAISTHHYLRSRGAFRPYLGGGVAWIRSGKLKVAADPTDSIAAGEISIQNKTTWVADAGFDIVAAQSFAITIAGRYTHYRANLDTTPDDLFQYLKLDPLTLSAGLRVRF